MHWQICNPEDPQCKQKVQHCLLSKKICQLNHLLKVRNHGLKQVIQTLNLTKQRWSVTMDARRPSLIATLLTNLVLQSMEWWLGTYSSGNTGQIWSASKMVKLHPSKKRINCKSRSRPLKASSATQSTVLGTKWNRHCRKTGNLTRKKRRSLPLKSLISLKKKLGLKNYKS